MQVTKDFLCSCQRCSSLWDDVRVFVCARCQGGGEAAMESHHVSPSVGEKSGGSFEFQLLMRSTLLEREFAPNVTGQKNLYVYKRTWAFQFLTAQVNHHETD